MHSTSLKPVAARTRAGVARLAVYYVVAGVAAVVLLRYVPIFAEAVAGGSISGAGIGTEAVFGPDTPAPVGDVLAAPSPWRQALLASISMLGALALMVPVTWVYMLIRRERGFDESVVHTLLILPVAVTGIVMVVKSSVALAFSLAGIVAAVRFRTTLDDTKDAVYVFLAIGVGLASGIQSMGVAVALSLVFNALVLVLWTTRFGEELHALPAGGAPLRVGDLGAVGTEAFSSGAGLSPNVEALISEERAKPKDKRANALLAVHAREAQGAQSYVEALLEEVAGRWRLAEIGPGPSGARMIYLVRLDGEGAQGAVMDRLRSGAGGAVESAELRSLKGIKPRE
ncbi:MAG: DUF4956 domain-containing protein [Longimicrobiales bacterium]